MAAFVLDSSVALSWLMPDERPEDGIALLNRVVDEGAVVPALWPMEMVNILVAAERRQRITAAHRVSALRDLASLPIVIDGEMAARAWHEIVDLALMRGLTAYDAAYLELALRRILPLATYDTALRKAAVAAGAAILPA